MISHTLSPPPAEIQMLYRKVLNNTLDAIPENLPTYNENFLKLGGLFISEIGMPFINGFIGMYALITDHIPDLDEGLIYLISVLFATIDNTVNYALVFPVYKTAAGFSRARIHFSWETNDASSSPPPTEASYWQHLARIILLIVFVGLRISGGYFIMTQFFNIIGAASLLATPIGFFVLWGVALLYVSQGFLTRVKPVSRFLSFPGQQAPSQPECCRNLRVMALFASEIGVPLINAFVGMCQFLTSHLSSLDHILVYSISIILSLIDAVVHYALMASVYKESAGLTREIKESATSSLEENLIFLDTLITQLIETEIYAKTTPLNEETMKELERYYQIIISEKSTAKSSTWRQEFLYGVLIGVFIALRISGGYFIMTHLFLSIAAASLMSTPLGLGIIWGATLLYAYEGYRTRCKATFKLACSSPHPEKFTEITHKFELLKTAQQIKQEARDEKQEGAYVPSVGLGQSSGQPTFFAKSRRFTNKDYEAIFSSASESEPASESAWLAWLQQKNRTFQLLKDLPDLNKHQHAWWDQCFFLTHTKTWKDTVEKMRKKAYNTFLRGLSSCQQQNNPTGTQNNDDLVSVLTTAKEMVIFKEHRNNWWLFGAFGRTKTVKKIDKHIAELRDNNTLNIRSI